LSEPSKFIQVRRTVQFSAIKTTKRYHKGRRVSAAYAKRYPHLVKKTEWVEIFERSIKFDPVKKRQVYGGWKIRSREKMNFFEKILPLKSITTRSVSDLLARNKVYSNIWQNNKGVIRITIEGIARGKRIKEVVHVGYLKSMWYGMREGYSKFKRYLVHKILQALGKRRLRISNSKESLERVHSLHRMANMAKDKLEYASSSEAVSLKKEVKGLTRLIKEQKQKEQIIRATLRIEKLVNH
jgi:hypothetical protein